ncbi:MAG: hypothetical protein J6M18_03485 [Actinomycetaceae bacterium]|nr:hypothetical protein [Actinomycetaceae bacterium]
MSFLNDAEEGIFIIHENSEWIPPFEDAFKRAHQPFHQWILTEGRIDLDREPPKGIFWSRLSASAPSRGHGLSKEYGRTVLAWLESYGRKVINGSDVLEFEVSKARQQLTLARAGFRVPRTQLAFSLLDALKAADSFGFPLIYKHNQGGKGIGVQLFRERDELEEYLLSNSYEDPVDGVAIIQEYVESAEPFITRLEFIGGKFHYAVRVDTSQGSFELCPADACNVDDVAERDTDFLRADMGINLTGFAPSACEADVPALAGAACEASDGVFTLREDINANTPFVAKLEEFLQKHHIDVAGIEFIETPEGDVVIYDINTNTNYNSFVEEKAHVRGADAIVAYLQREYNSQEK